MNAKKTLVALGCVLLSLLAGAIGSLATIPNIPTWYAALEKPPLLPPNWVFGPVWTVLYVMMGLALYLVVQAKAASKKRAYYLFSVQLLLNTVWSLVFFGLHMPWAGLVVILLLLAALTVTAKEFFRLSRLAGYFLIPYIAWVTFATYLTLGVAVLN